MMIFDVLHLYLLMKRKHNTQQHEGHCCEYLTYSYIRITQQSTINYNDNKIIIINRYKIQMNSLNTHAGHTDKKRCLFGCVVLIRQLKC